MHDTQKEAIMNTFKLGTCTVPDGEKGDWRISTFELTDEQIGLSNLRAIRDGNPEMVVLPGTYRRLTHKTRGVVMSNTPMEIRTCKEAYWNAEGHVLVSGLGMGMLLEALLSKIAVISVTVVEIEQDVIDLVAPHFANEPRVTIVHADAHAFLPPAGTKYDYAWHDIWDNMSAENLQDMAKLTRRYAKFMSKPGRQGVWSRDIVRRNERRWG
jgi:hypothetical protein